MNFVMAALWRTTECGASWSYRWMGNRVIASGPRGVTLGLSGDDGQVAWTADWTANIALGCSVGAIGRLSGRKKDARFIRATDGVIQALAQKGRLAYTAVAPGSDNQRFLRLDGRHFVVINPMDRPANEYHLMEFDPDAVALNSVQSWPKGFAVAGAGAIWLQGESSDLLRFSGTGNLQTHSLPRHELLLNATSTHVVTHDRATGNRNYWDPASLAMGSTTPAISVAMPGYPEHVVRGTTVIETPEAGVLLARDPLGTEHWRVAVDFLGRRLHVLGDYVLCGPLQSKLVDIRTGAVVWSGGATGEPMVDEHGRVLLAEDDSMWCLPQSLFVGGPAGGPHV